MQVLLFLTLAETVPAGSVKLPLLKYQPRNKVRVRSLLLVLRFYFSLAQLDDNVYT